MRRVICRKCNGNGYHPKPFEVHNFWFAIPTLGLSLIRDKQLCRVCEGYGYLDETNQPK